jgi:hypothetical protein
VSGHLLIGVPMSPGAGPRYTCDIAPNAPRRRQTVDWKLELIVVPVSDVDRAKSFYLDNVGFNLDVDHSAGEDFRVVQMTPPGSACSITTA